MVRLDFSLSKNYFRAVQFHSVRYWIGKIIGAAYLVYIVCYLYDLWFFGLLGRMARGIWFYFVLLCAFVVARSMIFSIPSVRAWRVKRKKVSITFTVSDEGIQADTFDGKMNSSHSVPFGSVKRTEEKDKYFTISYVSGRQKEYLLKSDITEGSVEELRQIFAGNLGDRFKDNKNITKEVI